MPHSQTILVTGAMGQLGKRVTQILLERSRNVIALDLDNEQTRAVIEELRSVSKNKGTLTPCFVNLLDAEGIKSAVLQYQPEAIIHLAAIIAPPCYKNPEFASRVNVDGTRNLVLAALQLEKSPLFLEASSSAVNGPRNPYRYPERLNAKTPSNPVDCYGEDKVRAEQIVAESGLRHAVFRLPAIISPDGLGKTDEEYLLLMRATPCDNRMHAIDARDAALAFANGVDCATAIDGKVLLIGGNDSYLLTQNDIEDDVLEAIGIGRLGPAARLPGDPSDDRGWGLTDWFDTTEAQQLLAFQEHNWSDTLAWLAASQGRMRFVLRLFAPFIRVSMRIHFLRQRKREKRGPYADPWALVSKRYGEKVLASTYKKSAAI